MYKLRNKIASVSRNTPYFRGKRRIGNTLSSMMTSFNQDKECIETIRMKNGSRMQLDVRSRTEQWPYWTGYYDDDVISRLSSCLKDKCVVLDVGANIGFYAVVLGHEVQKLNGKVYAFEPIRSNYDRLTTNVSINNLVDTVFAHNIALGDVHAEVEMSLENNNHSLTGNAVISQGKVPSDYFGVDSDSRVQMVQLDDFVLEHSIESCNLIKVDIEGAECKFLRGAKNFLGKTRPIILGEFNSYFMPRYGDSLVEVVNFFTSLGYRFFQKNQSNYFLEIKNPKNNAENLLIVPLETPKSILCGLGVIQ